MSVFNAWYYSFSPYVAKFERDQSWFQQIVRTSIYPLLGILTVAEKAYFLSPGEFGSLYAGLVSVSLIGAVYFWPFALASRQIRCNNRYNYKLAAGIFSSSLVAIVCSLVLGNQTALMITTSLFVLSLIAIFATMSASVIVKTYYRIQKTHFRFSRTKISMS